MLLLSTSAFADYLDLTTGGGGTLGQGVFLDAGTNTGSVGSGNIDSFVRVQQSGSEQGYNTGGRPVPFDENTSPTFTHDLALSELLLFNNPGNGVPDGDYYRFLLDINQEKSVPLLSLDQLRIYHSPTPSINSPTFAGMTLVWDIDAGGDSACGGLYDGATCSAQDGNGALLDYTLNRGSGNGIDMILWVPTSLFVGVGEDEYVYLYSAFGELGGDWATNAGYEEWARDVTPTGTPNTPTPSVPEPASLVLIGIGLTGIVAGKRFARNQQ